MSSPACVADAMSLAASLIGCVHDFGPEDTAAVLAPLRLSAEATALVVALAAAVNPEATTAELWGWTEGRGPRPPLRALPSPPVEPTPPRGRSALRAAHAAHNRCVVAGDPVPAFIAAQERVYQTLSRRILRAQRLLDGPTLPSARSIPQNAAERLV